LKIKIFGLLTLTFVHLSVIGQLNNSLTAFKLSDKYSQVQPKDSKIKPGNYQLPSSKGFSLNCLGYDFSQIRTLNNGKEPDAIFIICKAGSYMIKPNFSGITIIDKSTMESLDEKDKKFGGFEKGDTAILAIGTLRNNDGKAEMMSFWVAMIDVK
jgi:hypothetical protein